MSNVLRACRLGRTLLPAAILGALLGCETPPPHGPAPPSSPDAGESNVIAMVNPTIVRARSRWVSVDWSELPGWNADRSSEAWPALLRSCERPAPDWTALCARARTEATAVFADEAARAWMRQHLQAYRVEAMDGTSDGLLTGYFEPQVDASRTARGNFRIPIYAPPADLASRKPYWTRQQIDTLPAARASLRGRALAYVADPLDALMLQVQGSGRLNIVEPKGRDQLVRVAYAGNNDQPYQSVGRWLIDQGELPAAQASWPAIRAWAKQNPKRVNELLWSNPRVVFFREEPLLDPQRGPVGAQGVPLTPGRSIAVDPMSIPYGAPVWVDSTEPLAKTPLRRLVLAQDTGSAISGAVRADYFWGWGGDTEAQAGRMKQPLRLWVLWPRSPPASPAAPGAMPLPASGSNAAERLPDVARPRMSATTTKPP